MAGDRSVAIQLFYLAVNNHTNLTYPAAQCWRSHISFSRVRSTRSGLSLPSQIIAICPVVNLAMESPPMIPISKHDSMLTREYCRRISLQWAGMAIPSQPSSTTYSVPFPSGTLNNPYINPDAGDISILEKAGTRLIIVSATWDCLHAESIPFVDKAENAGAQLTYIEGERQFHDFAITVDVFPECRRAAELVTQTAIANGTKRATGNT